MWPSECPFLCFFFFLSFSLLFWFFFRTFSIGFCWPSSLAEIEMTLSVIWFGQRFHWQLARAATGHTTHDTVLGEGGQSDGSAAAAGVWGCTCFPLSPVPPEMVCDL